MSKWLRIVLKLLKDKLLYAVMEEGKRESVILHPAVLFTAIIHKQATPLNKIS